MKIENFVRGIRCCFSDQSDPVEFFKFADIDMSDEAFWIVDSMTYCEGDEWSNVENSIDFEQFKELNAISRGYLWLLMHIYPKDVTVKSIDTYGDFLKSDCEMIVLLYDSAYVDVYCKNKEWIEKMYNKLRTIAGSEFDLITDDNDMRIGMYD